ncbi:uncharacterized protein BX663DRAFT_510890 [Cokeromyces recurvatus]|uniref:uncharacterized protein n=1 Tax=Cokeromyces recurvatus TaxID=90255 RepID=UPI0022202430|nr:uncharacterized protein BX663DRAFT_510890 [Cokeromyces recurvatus]KAI7902370.1 hypothetical protein BX663DRAFT_510890 [Cokeromyces recurvatus]
MSIINQDDTIIIQPTHTEDETHIEISGEKNINQFEDVRQLQIQLQKLYKIYMMQTTCFKTLQSQLETERGQINHLREENEILKKETIKMSVMNEQEEEYISNKLLKHIAQLKKEKERLLIQVEEEEESLTNMLQKKLMKLQKEKVDMENALEQEQAIIVNRLQKQLDSFCKQQGPIRMSEVTSPIGSPLLAEKNWNTSHLHQHIESTFLGTTDALKVELMNLKTRTIEMEKEYLQKYEQCNKYRNELIQFRKKYSLLVTDLEDG